jgi:hypothetical protein
MIAAIVAGGVVLAVTGFLIFEVLLGDFYASNAGSATGVNRESQIVWAMAVGSLAYAALITYAAGRQPGGMTLRGGAVAGAIVGFLLWCTVDFFFYGISNISNLTLTTVDPLVELVHGGIGGAVIGAVLQRMPGRESSPAPMDV